MTKEMIQRKFSGLLELMALIQNDIENGLFDVAADYLGDVEDEADNLAAALSMSGTQTAPRTSNRRTIYDCLQCHKERIYAYERCSTSTRSRPAKENRPICR
ncbi:MAG TPA: hypothetical protein VK673_09065 [Chthoniobacterales bacterium]|nr:hypothetical protein [Chthoniobacterales bacterium]